MAQTLLTPGTGGGCNAARFGMSSACKGTRYGGGRSGVPWAGGGTCSYKRDGGAPGRGGWAKGGAAGAPERDEGASAAGAAPRPQGVLAKECCIRCVCDGLRRASKDCGRPRTRICVRVRARARSEVAEHRLALVELVGRLLERPRRRLFLVLNQLLQPLGAVRLLRARKGGRRFARVLCVCLFVRLFVW